MIAEIISIGDELTSGQRVDTNSQWISQQLADLGVATHYHTTVADDLAANVEVFRNAAARADLVIATGGLGPTADDLTRQTLAAVAAVPLVLDQGSLDHIRELFQRSQRAMPARNEVQALLPEGSRPIYNPGGTAPGIDMRIATPGGHTARVIALPGVPAEMFEMFAQSVRPAILDMQTVRRVICHRRIKCFGVGESQLEAMLPDLIARGREPTVGITVHAATITLRITAAGESREACLAAMEPTVATIRECLGNLIFGEEDDELEDAVLRLLAERHSSLATVEFGTRGLLAHWLSQAAAGTAVFVTSQVFHNPPNLTDQQKQQAGVSEHFDLTSRDYAESMALRCLEKTGCDYALAVGEFPLVTTADTAAPSYHLALASADGCQSIAGNLSAHPALWKARAAKQALNLLRLKLLGD